jgi:hypothetical protein
MTTKELEVAIDQVAQDETIPPVIRCDMIEELIETLARHLERLCRRRPTSRQWLQKSDEH